MASCWTIDAKRGSPLYEALRDIVGDTLPDHTIQLLREDSADPRVRYDVDLVPPTVVAHRQEEISQALDDHVEPGTSAAYRWTTMRPGLGCCLMYVSWSMISLRPLIAPTTTLPEFADARQHVYMSATLGEAGELERSFGIAKIDRIPLPAGWERQGSGRRLPLFPALAGEDSVPASVESALDMAKRSLVIGPSAREAEIAVELFVPEDIPVVNRDEVAVNFDAFTNQEKAVLVLANRYDGIDLPDEACRLVLLHGVPLGIHLQERFLFDKLSAREALDERIRTRITQGMGRATRNRQDYAAVLFTGQELISFLSREDVRAAMRPELQAELRAGA